MRSLLLYSWFVVLGFLFCQPAPALAQAEYRAQWVDVFHNGFLTSAQIPGLMQNLRAGNANVVIPEIRVYSNAYYQPHPAFYPALGSQATIYSNGVPIMTDLDSEPEPQALSFDALGQMIAQAHDTSNGKEPLEVWAWLVSFRSGPAMRNAHPDWLTRNADPASAQTDFDPGHPGVEQQLVNVCLDLVSNYDVDGLNFDYIRFTDAANGYNPVSIARFNAINGRTGAPSNTDPLWQQWRRDQVTSVMRKIYLSVLAIRPDVRISADTITWTPAPARPAANDPDPRAAWKTSFQKTQAYTAVYQDWRSWMEEGILDVALPMAYFRECTHAYAYDQWSDFTKENQFDRQGMIGPGTYLNSLDDSIAQLKRTRWPSAPGGKFATGQSIYSYASPYADSCGGTIVANPAGMAAALSGGTAADPTPIYPTPVPLPALPRLTSGLGHLKGTVTRQGAPSPGWVDGGTISLSGPVIRTMRTDGTGFYGFVDLPPGAYTLSARATGTQVATATVTVTAGAVATQDMVLTPGVSPDRLAFATSPGEALAGSPFGKQPIVQVLDTTGQVMTGYTGPVTVSIETGTGAAGAALLGAATVNAVNGVATFTDLAIDKAGAAYVLVAASGSLTAAESAAFDVVRPPSAGDAYRRVATLPNATNGAVWTLSGLGVNRNAGSRYYGYVYLTDRAAGQNKVRILSPEPYDAGTGAASYLDTGLVIQMEAGTFTPWDVSVGSDDAVWMADLGRRMIYSAPPVPPNIATSVAAVPQVDMNGFATSGSPRGLTVTGPVQDAHVYVAATSSSNAHAFTVSAASASTTGTATLAWTAGLGFNTGPYGVAVDTQGNSYWPRNVAQGGTVSAFVKAGPSGGMLPFDAVLPAWAIGFAAHTLQDAAFVADDTAPGGGYLYYAARVSTTAGFRAIVHRFAMDGTWLDGFGAAITGAPAAYTPIEIPASTVSTVAYVDADDRGSVYILGMDAGANAVIKVARIVPFTLADARRAALVAAGLEAGTTADLRLDVAAPSGAIDLVDATLLARKAAGLDANP